MKKLISIFLIFVMCFSLASCSFKPSGTSGDGRSKKPKAVNEELSISLPYSKGDTFDPFNCETINNFSLMPLVYSGLYKLDKASNALPDIAQSSIISADSITITVSDAKFSDGTPVTANDVASSFERAKKSANYEQTLSGISSVRISASNIVIFYLTVPDQFAVNCLTFPVIKAGSDDEMPTGAGRYYFKTVNDEISLLKNPYKTGFNPHITNISLIAINDSEGMKSSLEIGNTAFYFDYMSDGKYYRLNAYTKEFAVNSLMFVGMNNFNSIFSLPQVRQAVNLAVNRDEIASVAFRGHATVTYSPFSPDWNRLSADEIAFSQNIETAKQLIEESGIDVAQRTISLLVNADNDFKCEAANLVKGYLEELGFTVDVKEYTTDYFLEMIDIGGFDLYIGEVNLTGNMNLSCLFAHENGFGVDSEGGASVSYGNYLNSQCELMDFINAFNDDVPFVPVCYRNAVAYYTNSIKANYECCCYDLYYDIESWNIK